MLHAGSAGKRQFNNKGTPGRVLSDQRSSISLESLQFWLQLGLNPASSSEEGGVAMGLTRVAAGRGPHPSYDSGWT